MTGFIKHKSLEPHHRYQLEVIFLFAFGLLLFLPFYLALDEFDINMQTWQWVFFCPWMLFYIIYSLSMRKKITPEERVNPLKRPIAHWVLLGLTIVSFQMQPQNLTHIYSLDLMFFIFSLFLADSYWDFTSRLSL
jgi:hypothetical protein